MHDSRFEYATNKRAFRSDMLFVPFHSFFLYIIIGVRQAKKVTLGLGLV